MNRIFISYVRDDADQAKRLYTDLKVRGFGPWLDSEDLLPGAMWKDAICRTIEECSLFVALMSSRSINHRGYVQKELRIALEILEECSPEHIFIVPARLDDCRPRHRLLNELQWVDLFPDWGTGLQKLLLAIRANAELEEERAELRRSISNRAERLRRFNLRDAWREAEPSDDGVETPGGEYSRLLAEYESCRKELKLKFDEEYDPL